MIQEILITIQPFSNSSSFIFDYAGHASALGYGLSIEDVNAAIAQLRSAGETVVCVLPGHESEVDEFHCDRELANVGGQWVVQAI